MRTFLIILAWLGLVLIVFGTILSFSSSSTFVNTGELGTGIGYIVTLFVGVLGTGIALISGLLTTPKYLWIGFIITGFIYVTSWYGYILPSPNGYLFNVLTADKLYNPFTRIVWLLIMLLPGLVCITMGILLKFRKK